MTAKTHTHTHTREGEQPAMASGRLAIGTKVRVSFTGTVGDRMPDLSGTREVRELDGLTTHCLYLGSADGRVTVNFDAEVTGEYEANPFSTTQVRELRDGRPTGFTHYLFLESESIRVIDEKPAPEEAVATGVPGPGEQEDAGGTRISPGDDEIGSASVLSRLAELEKRLASATAFTITRARTGTRFAAGMAFRTRAAALEYLDELDYNPARFTITPALPAAEREELAQLNKLNDDGRMMFGPVQWITRGVLLRKEDLLDGDWARGQAAERLGVSFDPGRLDEWPLDGTDWEEAAGMLLNAEYSRVSFGSCAYWGKSHRR